MLMEGIMEILWRVFYRPLTMYTMVPHSIMQCETTTHGHMMSVYGQSGQ